MAYSKEVLSCSYPLYSIVQIGNEEFAVTGGGGQAKTGVPNGIVRSLQPIKDSIHTQCLIIVISSFCTESNFHKSGMVSSDTVIMNITI